MGQTIEFVFHYMFSLKKMKQLLNYSTFNIQESTVCTSKYVRWWGVSGVLRMIHKHSEIHSQSYKQVNLSQEEEERIESLPRALGCTRGSSTWTWSNVQIQTAPVIKATTWLREDIPTQQSKCWSLAAFIMSICIIYHGTLLPNAVQLFFSFHVHVCRTELVCLSGKGGAWYFSLYGQVCHSESAHSLHCGVVCGQP